MVAWTVTGRTSLLGVLAGAAGRALRRSGKTAGAVLLVAVRLLLVVGAAVAVTYGVYQASHAVGWIVGGLCALVLEWMIKRDRQ